MTNSAHQLRSIKIIILNSWAVQSNKIPRKNRNIYHFMAFFTKYFISGRSVYIFKLFWAPSSPGALILPIYIDTPLVKTIHKRRVNADFSLSIPKISYPVSYTHHFVSSIFCSVSRFRSPTRQSDSHFLPFSKAHCLVCGPRVSLT